MSAIVALPVAEREQLFRDSAETLAHLPPSLIEKDFWVVWCLGALFTTEAPASLIFKGGTSLSKVFGAIARFSEDIDISIDRTDLGFTGDRNPAAVSSGKQRRRLLTDLANAATDFVQGPLLQHLEAICREKLGEPSTESWSLSTTPEDSQTLLFRYPPTGLTPDAQEYTAPLVRLEFGARSDHWPSQSGTVRPYAAEAFPNEFPDESRQVDVLGVARTFWEKATKATFFPSAWASYDTARPGTLRLVPDEAVRIAVADDYARMQEMIFGEAPSFDEVLEALAGMEARFNG